MPGLTQAKMSKEIDISTSYLNLLGSNQRPLSLTVLMKTHERFNIDISEFTRDDSFELVNDLRHVFSDPLNIDTPMTKREISDFAQSFPNAAVALVNIFSRFEKSEQLSLKNFNEEMRDLCTVHSILSHRSFYAVAKASKILKHMPLNSGRIYLRMKKRM